MAVVGRGADQYTVRFPDGLRDRIREEAETNGRSMNAEIVARLEASFQPVSLPEVEEIARFTTHAVLDALRDNGALNMPAMREYLGKRRENDKS